MKFDSPYNPKKTEGRIYKLWEKSGFFNPDNLPISHKPRLRRGFGGQAKVKSYSVMMAPPNITGSLHMGHVLENTEVDILVRMKRMKGFKTLWLPGIDHAGIAAQSVVEKELRKEGLRRQDLGREKFILKVKKWKEKYGAIILDQLKMLGVSSDWSRTGYTMGSNYTKAVLEVFNHYYKKDWIYRGERVINWCPRCETGISDLEVEYKEEAGKLYFIKYPLAKSYKLKAISHIVVATTRPETMLGDTAVAVSPKDSRYKNLVGKFVILPIKNRVIPVIADVSIDMKFGTGAVKVTPAHDVIDFEISLRHNLPKPQIIDERGIMTAEAGKICEGLKVGECRDKVVLKLQELGLLQKIEDYKHNIAYCERCGAKIEPRLSQQWFLKMKELAKLTLDAIKKKETVIHPKKWEKVLLNRLKNERDWNISRQLWWGHRLPVWFHEPKCVPKIGHEGDIVKCEKFKVSVKKPKCEYCKAEFIQSDEVLDTWFSSALWPFATLGWPDKTNGLKRYYPTDFITSARDILNIWIAKMIFSGKELMGKTPFKIAHIHATILNKEGKRMSKSLGTGIDPLVLIDKYGADAVRFGIIYQNLGNQDIRFNEDAMLTGKKFCNKIWNASRFVLMQQTTNNKQQTTKSKTEADKKILKDLEKIIKEVNSGIEKYEFGHTLHKLYDFFWHEYANIYIETAKKQLRRSEEVGAPTKASELAESTQNVLLKIHTDLLKLLHPFLPFITEKIWGAFNPALKLKSGVNKKNLLLIEDWPSSHT